MATPTKVISGAATHDATDRIIYNPANGQLTFDADGNGADASILVAKLEAGLTVTASDFQVI